MRGRPPLPPAEKRRNRGLKLNDAEHAEVKGKAKLEGLPVAVWVRRRLLGR